MSKWQPATSGSTSQVKKASAVWARLISAALLFALSLYAIGIITGWVPAERRIDGPSLGVIVLGCLITIFLLKPELVERITRFEALGWKLEMEHRQSQQSNQLEDIQLVLPVLLPETERRHLTNLAAHTTAGYKGNHELRTELRRLRSLKLIEMQPDQMVQRMTDGSVFDLARYMRLTQLGERWAERLKQLETENANDAQSATQA